MSSMSQTEDVLEELAGLPTLAHPTVSPDGNKIAMYYDITGRNELHVLDIESGERKQWSDGEVPRNARWFVKWGADGDWVYFHFDKDGNEQNDVYRISPRGEVETVIEMDGQVVLNDVSEDGQTLIVGSTRDGQMNLYRHHLESSQTEKITSYNRATANAILSPECDRLAYSTNERDNFNNRDVYVAAADGSNPRNLDIGEIGAESTPVDWGPDNQQLLITDNTAEFDRIGVYDLKTHELKWLGDDQREESAVAFTPDGNRVIGIRVREAVSVPVVYDIESNEATEFDLPEGVARFGYGGSPTVDEGRAVLTHTSPTTRPDLLIYDYSIHDSEVLVEAVHGTFDSSDFVDAEYLRFNSNGIPEAQQTAIKHDPYKSLDIGALLYDSDERPSPLIVNPHGGPSARDTKSFDLYTQVLLSQGFSVLQINYRGSTGRGREFVRELHDDWGGAEQGDIMTGLEHVKETYDWIDDDRIAVFGGSYGGYSAYWQLVQYPDQYDAGVAWIGVTDLEDIFKNTMPHYRTELMEKYLGTPRENPDIYEQRSPVTHIENIDAPMLLVHGVNDRRVPVSQARIFRDALKQAGYEQGSDEDFEYQELGEEGHGSSDQDQKLRMFRLLTDFLNRRLSM
jgi:dipeptidyl aminopeptidase/acylaminoacyl peptidase